MHLKTSLEDGACNLRAPRSYMANKRSWSAPPADDSILIFSALFLPPRLRCKPV